MKHHRNLRVAVYQRQGDEEEDEARQRVVARREELRRKSGHDYLSSTRFHMAGKWKILINYKQIRFHPLPYNVKKNYRNKLYMLYI